MTSNHHLPPGAPIPLHANPLTEPVAEFGDYDHDNGVKVVLSGDYMIFMASHSGQELEIQVEIQAVLEAIGRHNKVIGN